MDHNVGWTRSRRALWLKGRLFIGVQQGSHQLIDASTEAPRRVSRWIVNTRSHFSLLERIWMTLEYLPLPNCKVSNRSRLNIVRNTVIRSFSFETAV